MSVVLIIEDDTLIARMYQKALSREGLEVVVASNGKEGIEQAKKIKPGLIFCDVMMPEVNGLEVLEKLKSIEELKSVPVVMLTNLSGTQDVDLAMKNGAQDYLVKSEFKPREIAAKAREIMGEWG